MSWHKMQVKSIPTLHYETVHSSWAGNKIRRTTKACLFKSVISCFLVAFATLSYLSETLFCGEKDLVNSFKSSLMFHIIRSALSVERGIAFEYTQELHNAGSHPSFSSSEELSMVCLKAVSAFSLYSLRTYIVLLCSALTTARFAASSWSTCLGALWLFVCSCITLYVWLH